MPTESNPHWDEVYQMISGWKTERVAAARVLVVGAGALGNEVLKNLALLNVGFIYIIDFDEIEYGNLSRSVLFRPDDVGQLKAEVAAKALRSMNPNCTVGWMKGDLLYDLGLGFLNTMDVFIGCLDNRIARLYLNRFAYRLGKTWINGALENLSGSLNVFKPGISCYECSLKPKEWDIIRYRLGCNDVAKRNANFGRIATTPISSSIIGAMQVQEAFKVINGDEEALLADQRFTYQGMANLAMFYAANPLKEDCLSHVSWDDVIEDPELRSEMTVASLLAALRSRFSVENPRIHLEYDIVLELYSEESRTSTPVLLPRFRIDEKIYREHQFTAGETVRIPPEMTLSHLDQGFPQQEASLSEVGIPPWQILQVEAGDDFFYVALAGDKGHYFNQEKNKAQQAVAEPKKIA